MRVAANDVERILQAAAAVVTSDNTHPSERQSIADVVNALKRAEELNYPLGMRRVRGRKSGQYRDVLATRQERSAKGSTYVLCIVPYTQTEVDGRRVSRVLPRHIQHAKYKSGEAPWPSHWHQQWINKGRLEAA